MTDNVVKSTDINQEKKEVTKKAPAKKAPAKKVAPKKDAEKIQSGESKLIYFESGFSYVSGGYSFTRENPLQEVPVEIADRLLELENFRLLNQIELEEYLANKEG